MEVPLAMGGTRLSPLRYWEVQNDRQGLSRKFCSGSTLLQSCPGLKALAPGSPQAVSSASGASLGCISYLEEVLGPLCTSVLYPAHSPLTQAF